MQEKHFYKRHDYEAVSDAPQSKTTWKTSQILSPGVTG